MSWDNVVIGIVPAAQREAANTLADSLHMGPIFSVALSADGKHPPTHYGCHALVEDIFLTRLISMQTGNFGDVAPTPEQLVAFNTIQISVNQEWAAAIAAAGLVIVQPLRKNAVHV